MKVRLKAPRVAVLDGLARSYERGETVDVPAAEARKMIESGQAEEAQPGSPEKR